MAADEIGTESAAPTPFELALEHELSGEFLRFANEWLAKWHGINDPGGRVVVDVEDFYGGRFHSGGVEFEGQIRDLFWMSVEKYLSDKVHDVFRRWSEAAKEYPLAVRRLSLDRTANIVQRFVTRTIDHTKDTDRRIRGKGFPKDVPETTAPGTETEMRALVERLRTSFGSLIPAPEPPKPAPFLRRAEAHFTAWRGVYAFVGLCVAILLGVLRLLL